MNVNPLLKTEREMWGARSILRRVNDGIYICSCSVTSDEYRRKQKNEFLMTVN